MAARKKGRKKAAARKPAKKAARRKAGRKKVAKKAMRRAKKGVRRAKKAVRRGRKKAGRKKAGKKATRKKAAKKATRRKGGRKKAGKKAAKKGKKKAAKRKPNPAFMKAMTPSSDLAAIVGGTPMPRTEVTKKLWAYIKKNNLQDARERRMINADDKLRKVLGKSRVSMFEMTRLVSAHLK